MKSRLITFVALPSLGTLVLLVFMPLLFVLLLSFAHREPNGTVEWILSLANYRRALDPVYLTIYLRSVMLALLTTLLTLVISFPVAYFIALQSSALRKNLLVFLVTLPFWSSFLIRTYTWIIILRAEGLVTRGLMAIGLIHEPVSLLYTPFAVLVGLVYTELPFMILPLYSVLEKIEKSLLDASADLGSSHWKTFWRVLMPLSRSGISAGVILVFIPSLGAFITPDLLGGAKSLMVGNLIQSQFAVIRDHPFGAANAALLTLLVIGVVIFRHQSSKQSAEVRLF